MTKKKKKKPVPKRTTLQRPQCLLIARDWLGSYSGKNIVRGYAKHFATDLLCAIKELRKVGVTVAAEYEEAVKRAMADRAEQNRRKKEALMVKNDHDDLLDEDFSFIAGYTEGGAPYGTRWEETSADGYSSQPFP